MLQKYMVLPPSRPEPGNGDDAPSDVTLARFLAGECPPAEQRFVEVWLSADATHRARLDEIRRLLTPPADDQWDLDQVWHAVKTAMGPASGHPPIAALRMLPPPRRGYGRQVAAAVLLVCAIGGTWLYLRHGTVPGPPPPPTVREYATTRGERAVVQLGDGTTITLAPESRLDVPGAFGDRTRDVTLTGEAIFDVAHDTAHVFRVHVGHAVATDVGTQFDVRAYVPDSMVAVAVRQGAVSLGSAGGFPIRRILRRGQLGRIDAHGHLAYDSPPSLAEYFDWAEGRLRFDRVPLAVVLETIGRWYDLDFDIANPSLRARLVTAHFSTQAPDDMIAALAAAVGARVERHGRVVTLVAGPP